MDDEEEPPTTPARPADAAQTRLCDRIAWGMLAAMLALLLHGAWRVGPTYDEHFYAAAGYAYIEDGDFSLNREHPPLAKMLMGLPLHLAPGVDFPGQWQHLLDYPVTFFYQRNADDLDRNLFLARLLPSLLTVLMAFGVYRTSRRLFSPRAGLVSLALIAFNPSVLAHGRLAALDMSVSVLIFLAAVSFGELLREPTPRRRLGAAALFGLANLAKFTALILGPFFILLTLVQLVRERRARPLGLLATTFLGGLAVFAAGYGFEAKSINEAFGDERYHVSEGIPKARVIAAATEAGMPADALEQLKPIHNRGGWIGKLGQVLDHGGEYRDASLLALRELARGPVEDRRLAYSVVLSGADDTGDGKPGLALEVLSDLSDVEHASVQDARVWFEQYSLAPWNPAIFTQGWIERITRGLLGDERPIPLLTAFKGIDYQFHHGAAGHRTYFRGEVLTERDFTDGNPHPEYYAWVVGIKNPLAFLALTALGLLLAFVPRPGWDLQRLIVFVGLPLLLFALFSNGRALLGIKYVLPVLPFLAVLAGRVAQLLPRTALALCAVSLLEWVWIHPHELMYYNLAAGGPTSGPTISVVGDDWGQDVRGLGRFYQRYQEQIDAAGGLHYDPYSRADMAAFGLQHAQPITDPVRGIVAVNVVNYHRELGKYDWLGDYQPFHMIGWSVYVYDTREAAPGGSPLPDWDG